MLRRFQRFGFITAHNRYFQSFPPNAKFFNHYQNFKNVSKNDTLLYVSSIWIVVLGLSYAAVPLYRVFCQATGYAGSVITKELSETRFRADNPDEERKIKITFNADVSPTLKWAFKPLTKSVSFHTCRYPGETALTFYEASNNEEKPIIGISTYNVCPLKAGQYFNKIQCFCFEEQLLKPGETVEMPIFFFIDREFAKDPDMANVDEIILSYTFFDARLGEKYFPENLQRENLLVNETAQ